MTNERLLNALLLLFALAICYLTVGCSNSPLQPTAAIGTADDCIARIVATMPTDEYRALYAGLDTARVTRPGLSVVTFTREQMHLYVTANESDPRLLTFFYGDTFNALLACEAR